MIRQSLIQLNQFPMSPSTFVVCAVLAAACLAVGAPIDVGYEHMFDTHNATVENVCVAVPSLPAW